MGRSDLPAFPEFKWDDYFWVTSARLPAWSGYQMTIFPGKYRAGRWKYVFEGVFSNGSFQTPDEAKLGLFDEYWKATHPGV